MCKWNTTKQLKIDSKIIDIDECIFNLVKILNENNFSTVASCCGHDKGIGNIALKDGRELFICPDFKTGRKIDDLLFKVDYYLTESK